MNEDQIQACKEYIKRTEEIRILSTPSLEDIGDAEKYTEKLRSNFVRIGELAAMNREFLDSCLFPMLRSEELFRDDDIDGLKGLSEALITAEEAENLDLSIVSMIEDRLAADADRKHDFRMKVERMDALMSVYYELMITTSRIFSYPEICEHYRNKGLKLGEDFMRLLEKESFKSIDDVELRQMILTNARYAASMFDSLKGDPKANQTQILWLERMCEVAEDPFYLEALGDYDWIYHRFRTLQYYGLMPEKNNAAGFNSGELQLILQRTEEFAAFCEKYEEYIRNELECGVDLINIDVMLERIRYLTGKSCREDYFEALFKMYHDHGDEAFMKGAYEVNLVIPRELFALIDQEHMTEREKTILNEMYRKLLSDAFQMPNGGGMMSFLTFYAEFIEQFIEVPSGISFADMVQQSMAALHPPTYVHSQMVGQLTECMCAHLIRLKPEALLGVLGCSDVEEVRKKRDEIVDYAYHAAILHDAGKLSIIDTVFIYGRRLLDMEFDLIKTHPRTGFELMMKYPSTRRYAEVALGHHKWYDNSRGYPEEFDTAGSPVKPIIDLVLCADCLDAATDTVGRSYNRGKSLDDFLKELEEGSGTRYAPWLAALFRDSKLAEDLNYLLTEGRQQNYQKIFYLLRDMQEQKEDHQ